MTYIKNEATTQYQLLGNVDLELNIWEALWKKVVLRSWTHGLYFYYLYFICYF